MVSKMLVFCSVRDVSTCTGGLREVVDADMLRCAVQEGSLNCVTAGYFARVVGTLLFRRTADIMRYLESHQAVGGALPCFPSLSSPKARLLRAADVYKWPVPEICSASGVLTDVRIVSSSWALARAHKPRRVAVAFCSTIREQQASCPNMNESGGTNAFLSAVGAAPADLAPGHDVHRGDRGTPGRRGGADRHVPGAHPGPRKTWAKP